MARDPKRLKADDVEELIAAKIGVSQRTVRRYLRDDPLPKPSPVEQEQPWITDGISRRTWYRRRKQMTKP